MIAAALVGILCLLPAPLADNVVVQIAWVPHAFKSDPTIAWRLSVLDDRSIRYEESNVPVSVSEPEFSWVAKPTPNRARLSQRRMNALHLGLEALALADLKPAYSAERSWREEGAAVDTWKIVLHGSTYRLVVGDNGGTTETEVYAPILATEDPEQPERDAIRRFLAAWYLVLKAVGPIHWFRAKDFRQYAQPG